MQVIRLLGSTVLNNLLYPCFSLGESPVISNLSEPDADSMYI